MKPKEKFPQIIIAEGYDSIEVEDGRKGFGLYVPEEREIYIAGDLPIEMFMKALFHELMHWIQDVCGKAFDENEAESFSKTLYDAISSRIETQEGG